MKISKAKTCLFAVFTRIMSLKSTKEIWNYLKAEYEGDERIRGMQVLNLIREGVWTTENDRVRIHKRVLWLAKQSEVDWVCVKRFKNCGKIACNDFREVWSHHNNPREHKGPIKNFSWQDFCILRSPWPVSSSRNRSEYSLLALRVLFYGFWLLHSLQCSNSPLVNTIGDTAANRHVFVFDLFIFFSLCDFICVIVGF